MGGVVGQGFRFALSGGAVALVYMAVTTLLHALLGFPFQLALALGYVTSASVHYTLQRVFVWRHEQRFALEVHRQLARYLCVSLSQYGLTALMSAQLPGPLGVSVEAVYLCSALTLAVVNFLIFRSRVFHAHRADAGHVVADPVPSPAAPPARAGVGL